MGSDSAVGDTVCFCFSHHIRSQCVFRKPRTRPGNHLEAGRMAKIVQSPSLRGCFRACKSHLLWAEHGISFPHDRLPFREVRFPLAISIAQALFLVGCGRWCWAWHKWCNDVTATGPFSGRGARVGFEMAREGVRTIGKHLKVRFIREAKTSVLLDRTRCYLIALG